MNRNRSSSKKRFCRKKTDTDGGSCETKEVDLTALEKATAETEAFHKEGSFEETDTDGGSGETKEVDLMAVAEATVELEAVLREYSADETGTDETKEVDGSSKSNSRNRSSSQRRF